MKKLLVTGASGFLGWNLCREALQTWQVFGTTWRYSPEIPGCSRISVNLTDSAACAILFKEIRPDAVIHLAAPSQPNFCQEHPEESRRINASVPIHLAQRCVDAGIPFVFTSTDLVFDGKNPPYTEGDQVCPISIYGEQKLEAEHGIALQYPEAAICRMPLMFGTSSPCSSSFMQPIFDALSRAEPVKLFCDEYRTPVSATDAVKGLLSAVSRPGGIIHLGGHERISRFAFGRKLAAICGFAPSLLIPVEQQSVAMPAPRPKDVSLDSSRAFSTGYAPRLIDEALKQIFKV